MCGEKRFLVYWLPVRLVARLAAAQQIPPTIAATDLEEPASPGGLAMGKLGDRST